MSFNNNFFICVHFSFGGIGISKKSSVFYFFCGTSFKHKIKGIYWETTFKNISETVVKTCEKDFS